MGWFSEIEMEMLGASIRAIANYEKDWRPTGMALASPGGNRRRDAPRAYINAIQLAKATSTNVRIAITFGAELKKP